MKRTVLKNLVVTGLAAAMMLSLAGCGQSSAAPAANTTAATASAEEASTEEAAPDDALAAIQAAGVLKVGTEGTYQPRSYHDENDELTGFDVAVAKAIAEKLGVEAEFVETPWDSMVAGLDSGKFDIIVNDMAPTEERREKFDFTDSYSFGKRVLVVSEDNNELTSFEGLEGKTVATEAASTTVQIAEGFGASILAVTGSEAAIESVKTGRADAVILPDVMFASIQKNNPDNGLKSVAEIDAGDEAAIPVRKGEDRLLEALNTAIDELQADGTIKALSEEFFGVDISEK